MVEEFLTPGSDKNGKHTGTPDRDEECVPCPEQCTAARASEGDTGQDTRASNEPSAKFSQS